MDNIQQPSRTETPAAELQQTNWRHLLECAYRACVSRAHPSQCLPPHLSSLPSANRVVVVGAGKASAAMANVLEQHIQRPVEGVVITRYGHAAPTRGIQVIEAGHPLPDEMSLEGTSAIINVLRLTGPDDLIIGLFSGGSSSLLCAPVAPLTLNDKRAVNKALLASGLPIDEMNCVRKHLSAVKGGKLPSFAPGVRMINFLLSDVPSDDPATIGSGPTVGSDQARDEALRIATRSGMKLPKTAWKALRKSANAPTKPASRTLALVHNQLISTPQQALGAACDLISSMEIDVIFLGADLEGEASSLGRAHAAIALSKSRVSRPLCIISGGETTVTLTSDGGRGGRNTEYLLGFALAMEGATNFIAMAADTDGIDGIGEHAGAFVDATTIAQARDAGIDPVDMLLKHRSLDVFEAAGTVFRPGPTQTNVNDFRAIILFPQDDA
ncbi:MAG: glycerate kinase type-2 family protein [Beijerinckiaceae bacterium]